jgi:hypothetical protein
MGTKVTKTMEEVAKSLNIPVADIERWESASKAGTAIGAATELAVGETLTARTLEFLRTLVPGDASTMMLAFWMGFNKAAPSVRGMKRVKVTRSESLRIARGVDAGIPVGTSWAESVKASPKAEAGKGAGGGRKPRPASGEPAKKAGEVVTIKPGEPAKPEASVVISTMATGRQLVAQLVAFEHAHKSKLSVAFINAVEHLAKVAKAELK